MDSEWIVGRKEIAKALHLDHWDSVRRWRKKYGLTFITFPNGKPAIQKSALDVFLTAFGTRSARHMYTYVNSTKMGKSSHDTRGKTEDRPGNYGRNSSKNH